VQAGRELEEDPCGRRNDYSADNGGGDLLSSVDLL
jgi:hypothetical protein